MYFSNFLSDFYRDSRRSPTYEAYSRSRRYIVSYRAFTSNLTSLVDHWTSVLFLGRSRSKSRSYSPSHSRRYSRGLHSDDTHRSKDSGPKIEYITEFGGSGNGDEPKLEGYSPPPSPPSQVDALNRSEHSTFNSCKDRLDSLYSAAA